LYFRASKTRHLRSRSRTLTAAGRTTTLAAMLHHRRLHAI
jgi:hypothetical protein